MIATKHVKNMSQRVELLAPVGRYEALVAVLDAGADAVYLSGKRFNMRRHRSDFHFDDEQLAQAIQLVHQRGKRIYLVLNTMLGETETQDVGAVLQQADALGVDAMIVQDLATIELARELEIKTELHASTMMNVHCVEQARQLKRLGISRVIPSRDIPLNEAERIGREANIEIECFVHGDMCVSHSGQCGMSGVLFGKSGNRGECMKPCRWDYELVRLDNNEVLGQTSQGHLLSINDLCLVRNIPELIHAGVCSFKIEGRMRDAAYLGDLVACYRKAIDAYYQNPATFSVEVSVIEQAYKNQVRQLSTLTILGGESHRGMIDTTGQREPMFLSNGVVEQDFQQDFESLNDCALTHSASDLTARAIDLAVCVSNLPSAREALEHGADRIDLAAELSQKQNAGWPIQETLEFIDQAHDCGARIGLRTPRVTDGRHWDETLWMINQLADRGVDVILAHHLGTLALAQQACPNAHAIADYGFNILNASATQALHKLGAHRATVSNEAGMADITQLAQNPAMPLEIFVHGSVEGMLVDHCVIALHATASGRKDICRGPCRHVDFGLRDKRGQVRPIIADQHCRNHMLTGHDLGTLAILERLAHPNVAAMRIEAQFYDSQIVGQITQAYKQRLLAITQPLDTNTWAALNQNSPHPLNLGAYPRSVVNTQATPTVMRQAASVSV